MPEIHPPPPDAAAGPRERLYVACQLGGWTTFALVYLALAMARGDVTVRGQRIDTRVTAVDVALLVATICLGLLLTHGFRMWIHRKKWQQLALLPLLPRVVTASFVLSALWVALTWPVGHFLGDASKVDVQISDATLVIFSVFNSFIFMFIWSALYFGYHAFERYRRSEVDRWQLQSAVKEAELRALKSQVNPHFIFNSLNSLRALIDENPARARSAVTQLANLLRYSLQSGQLETVPLEEELRIVKDYLALEQVRHEDRLRVRFEVSPEAAGVAVPPMLLQTLVENAVKYGIAPRREGGEIAILAHRGAGGLCIRVTNPGRLVPNGTSTGMGLHNAAERLRLLFGDRARLSLREESPGLVVAEVEVPAAARPDGALERIAASSAASAA